MKLVHVRPRALVPVGLAVFLVLGGMALRQRVGRMDGRFFQPSRAGAQALIRYAVGDYGAAARAYRAHFQTAPLPDGSHRSLWGRVLRGELREAEALAAQALERDPDAIEPLLVLAEIALERGRPERAGPLLERILRRDPDQAEALLLRSVVLARSRSYGPAIDALNRGLRSTDAADSLPAFLTVLETTGDLASLPQRERPTCLLAHYHRYLRIFDDWHGGRAIAYAEQAIAAGDRPDDAHLTKGVVYDKQGKHERSLKALLEAVRLNPRNAEALRWASIEYERRGDLLNEYRMARAAAEAAPADPFYFDRVGHVLIDKLGDPRQTLELGQAALAVRPDNGAALGLVARAHQFLGDHERAVALYREALRFWPGVASYQRRLGHSLQEIGRVDEAIAAYRAAVALEPAEAWTRTQLGFLLFQHKRNEEALRELEAAWQLGERRPGSVVYLCLVYSATSQYQQAVTCFNWVLEQEPGNVTAKHGVGTARRGLEQGKAR